MNTKLLIGPTGSLVLAAALLAIWAMAPEKGPHPSSSIGAQQPRAMVAGVSAKQELFKPNERANLPAARVTSAEATARSVWVAKFRASDDYLKFIVEALPAAQSGDGRAAWYIGEALTSCALVMKTYRGSADPEAQLTQELTNMPRAPQWGRDLLVQKTRRCLGLAQRDPFEQLPQVKGGYTSMYWHEQALARGDPLAHENKAAQVLSELSVAQRPSESEKQEKLEVVAMHLRAAIESGDPDALFNAGVLLGDGRYSTTPLNGIAVALAACELGRDCSADNPDNVFSRCKLSGACPANADYAYFVQQSMGPGEYAQAYARAQEIKRASEVGDWSDVLENLKVDQIRQ